jgi:hypothetical protein
MSDNAFMDSFGPDRLLRRKQVQRYTPGHEDAPQSQQSQHYQDINVSDNRKQEKLREDYFSSSEVFERLMGRIDKIADSKRAMQRVDGERPAYKKHAEAVEELLEDLKEMKGEHKALVFALQEFYSTLGPNGTENWFEYIDNFESSAKEFDVNSMKEYGRKMYQTTIPLFAYYTKIFSNQKDQIEMFESALDKYRDLIIQIHEENQSFKKQFEEAKEHVSYKHMAEELQSKVAFLEKELIARGTTQAQVRTVLMQPQQVPVQQIPMQQPVQYVPQPIPQVAQQPIQQPIQQQIPQVYVQYPQPVQSQQQMQNQVPPHIEENEDPSVIKAKERRILEASSQQEKPYSDKDIERIIAAGRVPLKKKE